MEPEKSKQLSKITDREKVRFNIRLFTYLFFLFISVILWYLIALSKDYTTVINCPVQYEAYPKGKALVSDMPEKLSLKIKGLGFSILRCKLATYLKPVVIPVGNFRFDIVRRENGYIYNLLTRYAKDAVGNQLSSDIQLVDIKPDTLAFTFADVVEKKVPVKPMLKLHFEKQFLQHGKLLVSPDSIVVSGPQVIIDTLKFVTTRELVLDNVKDSVIKEVELQPLNRLTKKKFG